MKNRKVMKMKNFISERMLGPLIVLKALDDTDETYPSAIAWRINKTHGYIVQCLEKLEKLGLVKDMGRRDTHNWLLTKKGSRIVSDYGFLVGKIEELNNIIKKKRF